MKIKESEICIMDQIWLAYFSSRKCDEGFGEIEGHGDDEGSKMEKWSST